MKVKLHLNLQTKLIAAVVIICIPVILTTILALGTLSSHADGTARS